ncbi:hypothetical protein [Nostoc sp.]
MVRCRVSCFAIAPNCQRGYWALVWRVGLAVVAMVSAVVGRWRCWYW